MELNKIIEGMLDNVNKYYKKDLIELLNLKVKNPVLNPKHYSFELENLYIYLNKKNEILGFTVGNLPSKKLNTKYALAPTFSRNMKNLLKYSSNILMFSIDNYESII